MLCLENITVLFHDSSKKSLISLFSVVSVIALTCVLQKPVLPCSVEDIIHDVCNYFAHSAKRLAEFKQFQYFAETELHRLLHPCKTYWLLLHSCVSRLVEQWDTLLGYFEAAVPTDKLLVSQKNSWLSEEPHIEAIYSVLRFCSTKIH